MKKLFTLLLVCACFYSEGQIIFQKTYGGTDWEEGRSVQQTTDGGYIIAGKTSSFGVGYDDVYLIKTDAYGDTLWTKNFGGAWYRRGYSVQQTNDGGYIITGDIVISGPGDWDVYLIKTDVNGNSLWVKSFVVTGDEWGNSVQQTTDGGYIITGGTDTLGGVNRDVYLIKTDVNGDTLWTKTFGGTGDEIGLSVQQTTDGGYIIAGWTNSFGAGSEDVYLIKTDTNGDTLWTKTFGGTNMDHSFSVKQTTDGGYIITGYYGTLNSDVYLIKTDANGDTLWTKTFGGTSLETGISVQQTTDGGYIIAGYTWSFGAGSFPDIYLIKTDANGDTLWTKTFGGTDYEFCYSVQQTTDGGYIIAGETGSFGAGVRDIYLIKTDSLGNSGCNEGNPATIVTTPATQVSSPATVVGSANTIVTSPATVVGSGGIVTTLCTTTGINPISNFQPSISISPNPSSGIFTITFPENFQKGTIEIYNVMGEKIYSDEINNILKKEIHLKNINAGVYFVKVFDGEKCYCKKLIVE